MKNYYDIILALISVVAIILSILSLTKSEKFGNCETYANNQEKKSQGSRNTEFNTCWNKLLAVCSGSDSSTKQSSYYNSRTGKYFTCGQLRTDPSPMFI